MPLFGLMQNWPLTLNRFLDHAMRWMPDQTVVSAYDDGIRHKNYRDVRSDAAKLSSALLDVGVSRGDRIATLAMNSVEHLQAWYAITGIGAVCHTLNPRLFIDQLVYIINHAEDRMILVDARFASLLEKLQPDCPTIERVVFLTGDAPTSLPVPVSTLADFTRDHSEQCQWGGFDENMAAGLCYTSGTTGDPKGVLYSHRSNFLHALSSVQPDLFGISANDVVLAVVPMFHANSWGLTFSVPAVGARLVLPGAQLGGQALYRLIESERVTMSAGVPTVWLDLLDYAEGSDSKFSSLKRVFIGGAACPESLLIRFRNLGVEAFHAWGMTELSPLGTVSMLTPEISALPFEQQLPWRRKQGRPFCGVDLIIADDDGSPLPHDGATQGRLLVKGPGVVQSYFGQDTSAVDENGWFDTGDIATIDAQGFMHIRDRAKDIIKSGGEWISSIDVENAALEHPNVALAAVIGVPHPKWTERPRLYIKWHQGINPDPEMLRQFLTERIARWWVPDEILAIEEMPLGATGKIDKKALRTMAVQSQEIA